MAAVDVRTYGLEGEKALSSAGKPRPERFEDLDADGEGFEVARIVLDPEALTEGLLAEADSFVQALRRMHVPAVRVSEDLGVLVVRRALTEAERAAALEKAQASWDAERAAEAEAAERDALGVGDEIGVSVSASARCRVYTGRDCDLYYGHRGDCIGIDGGRVASRTPRTPRRPGVSA